MSNSKKKKPVDINVETPKVVASLKTDGKGNLEATLDTKHVDIEVTNNAEGLKIHVDIDDDKEYDFESNGVDGNLPKGTVWKITGEFVKIFLKRGLGKIKK